MRTIPSSAVTEAVAELCTKANRYLPDDVRTAFTRAAAEEDAPAAKEIFRQLTENCLLAERSGLPLCQDTGLAVLFISVGQNLHIDGQPLRDAVTEGVRKGYDMLRKSVCDPFSRANTGDNTPAVIHFDITPGDALHIAFMAKGGGSENMSRVTMLAPSQGWQGATDFVVRRVAEAGPNPCPPIIVGVGIGGNFELAPLLAKKALLRKIDDVNPDPDLANKEQELLRRINALGTGPMGLGGKTTALAVKIAAAPCHIASLPLAVNIQCHSARHMEVTL